MSSYDNQPAVLLRWIQHQSVEWLGKPKKITWSNPPSSETSSFLSDRFFNKMLSSFCFVWCSLNLTSKDLCGYLYCFLFVDLMQEMIVLCFCVKHFMKLWTEIYRRNKITECKSTEISSIQKNVLMFNMWNKYQHFNILKFKEIKIILNSPKELLKLYSTRSEEHSGPNNSKRKN